MEKIQTLIQLTRLNKPTGFLLLFWPCVWGLTLGYYFNNETTLYLKHIILFFLGSVLMRSAGCIVNDIVDKDLDKKVQRTKKRPLASSKISVKLAWSYTLGLCFFAFLILINFNLFTIILAIGSIPFVFTYPLMKRFTYWPQFFLGITFNYGIILGWVSINDSLNLAPVILYIGAIFWTLGYDTIYGFQDIKDDEAIGLKSTSIKFKKKPSLFLISCYLITITCLLVIGTIMKFNFIFYTFLIIPFLHLFFYQIKNLNIEISENCSKIFRSNNTLGFLIFINLLLGKIFI